ncbi:MAG: peptidoglycan DL-endopeptidase CwlO, partial [Thermoleophilaceae bacterium]|nr:peptidoglycan DL-endopeptidase CwlO [Thermoleophilaceae bacterium]
MRRRLTTACLAIVALLATAPAATAGPGDWNAAEQKAVAHAGIIDPVSGGFHGERPLTTGQLRAALAALSARSGGAPTRVGDAAPTVASFDRTLVAQLGLTDVAAAVQAEAHRAGLNPPARFGSEVVARRLKLRTNHPAGSDSLELFPSDHITRAEAAHSFAVILGFSGWETQSARDVLGRFKLPAYDAKQRQALSLAVSKIGMPYIWGGESDGRGGAYGAQAHGGYDCSGFAWRVFKLSGNPAGRGIGGRTAEQMATEIPAARRLRLSQVRGADLVFFNTPISHMGIALSSDWMIHSSDQGVFVAPLFEDWRRASFRWARRVL